jgi:hypothetical protein
MDIVRNLDCQHRLGRAGLFQIVKLTIKNRWVEKMSPSFLQLRGNSLPTSAQKNEFNVLAHAKLIAICLFQRGARKNGIHFRVNTSLNQLPQSLQPGLPIFVG